MTIASQISALQQDKIDIAAAITNKGGTVNSGDGFDDFAADIATIPTGGEYSGLTTHYNGGNIVKIDGGALEDFSVVDGDEIALANGLAPQGKYLITTNGNVTNTDGVYSDFNSYNYLAVPVEINTEKPWSVTVKLHTNSNLYNDGYIVANARQRPASGPETVFRLQQSRDALNFWITFKDDTFISNGSNNVFAADETCTIKFEYTGQNYIIYKKAGDDWSIILVIDRDTPLSNNIQLTFGGNWQGNYFKGSIDMTASEIVSDGKIIWNYDNYFSMSNNIGFYDKIIHTNLETVGSVYMQDNGITSGFTGSTNYVQYNNTTPSSITQFKAIFKGYMNPGFTNHYTVMAQTTGSRNSILLRYGDYFSVYPGSWVQGVTQLNRNTWYWFGIELDGGVYKGYVLEDNNYTLETLPEFSQWSLEWTNALTGFFENMTWTFGSNLRSTSENWVGPLDLGQSKITINNQTYFDWTMTSNEVYTKSVKGNKLGVGDSSSERTYNIYYHKNNSPYVDRLILDNNTVSDANYISAGTVTIPAHTVRTGWLTTYYKINGTLKYSPIPNTEMVGFTGFSTYNNIVANYFSSLTATDYANGFEYTFHIKTPTFSSYTGDHVIMSGGLTASYGVCMSLYKSGSDIYVWAALCGANTRYITLSGATSMQPGTEYWVRLYHEAGTSDTKTQYSSDGVNWTDVATSTTAITNSVMANTQMVIGARGDAEYTFKDDGVIYDDSFIKIGGNTVWTMQLGFIPDPV